MREELLNKLVKRFWDLVDSGDNFKEAFQKVVNDADNLTWPEIERLGNLVGYRPWRTVLLPNPKKRSKKRGKLTGAAKAAFLARMAKGRRKAGRRPAQKRSARRARSNPIPRKFAFKITARKGSGPKMHFDGSKFSQRASVKTFSTVNAAAQHAQHLLRKYAVLRQYQVAVEPHSSFR